MFISSVLESYRLARRLADNSTYQINRTIALFASHVGQAPTLTDFDPDVVNRWLTNLEARLSMRTVAGHRERLLSLWRYACDELGLCGPPKRIRKAPKPHPMPVAWDPAEMAKLLSTADSLTGRLIDGTDRRTYFLCILSFAYDTGLRRSDLWAIHRDQIRMDGSVIVRQHKTRYPVYPQLSEQSLRLLKNLKNEFPLRWPGAPRQFYRHWNKIVEAAEVRPGALQQIRRTAATYLAKTDRSAVQEFLGHASPIMQKHYIDETQARRRDIRPPRFWWQ